MWATVGVGVSVHALSCYGLATAGTEEQRQRWLPDMLGGELLGAYCLSEPHAGSDPAAMRTTARRDGDEWVIKGTKAWTTHGGFADFYKVMARTGDGRNGISCFLVPADAPGLSADPPEKKMGLTGSTTTAMDFDDVRIPADRLIGDGGRGAQDRLLRASTPAGSASRPSPPGWPRAPWTRGRLRPGAGDLRQADHRPPGARVRARRHGGHHPDRPRDHPARRPAPRPRAAVQPRGLDRQAGRHRQRHEGDHRRRPGLRRLRLHPRLPGRALHARGQGDADLRGHQPDPADGHRPPPRPGQRRGGSSRHDRPPDPERTARGRTTTTCRPQHHRPAGPGVDRLRAHGVALRERSGPTGIRTTRSTTSSRASCTSSRTAPPSSPGRATPWSSSPAPRRRTSPPSTPGCWRSTAPTLRDWGRATSPSAASTTEGFDDLARCNG